MSKKLWIAVIAFLCVVGILVGVYMANRPQVQEGAKTITIEIVHADGKSKTLTVNTDEEYLDKVLIAEGLIKETDIVDGYFEVLDGETASWNDDQAYWSFYIGEEYASTGICQTPVEDGATYRFIYDISNW